MDFFILDEEYVIGLSILPPKIHLDYFSCDKALKTNFKEFHTFLTINSKVEIRREIYCTYKKCIMNLIGNLKL